MYYKIVSQLDEENQLGKKQFQKTLPRKLDFNRLKEVAV